MSPTAKPESWQDTLRTVAGYTDILIARIGHPLSRAELTDWLMRPLLNGGDFGPNAEHPSQALIDLFAMERLGAVTELRIAVCGDLRMRVVRSLLRLLARTPPRRLVLITDPTLANDEAPPAPLSSSPNIVRHGTSPISMCYTWLAYPTVRYPLTNVAVCG